MELSDIIALIYTQYVDENIIFNYKLFKEEHLDLYNILIDKFKNINNVCIYLSLNKTKNTNIKQINDLKNFLILNYLEESKLNGKIYSDLIRGTNFTPQQVSILYKCLKENK